MFQLFISAFLLGLIFNAAPGAILAESLRRGLKGGFAPAFAVQIGSLVGDALWVIIGLSGAAILLSIPHVHIPLSICGVALLGYLAYESFQDAMKPVFCLNSETPKNENKNALMTGVGLSISNPLNITYWAALGGTISAISGENPTALHFTTFITGFMVSSILWCFIASGLIAITKVYINQSLWKLLHIGCGIGLCAIMLYVIRGIFAF